MAKIPLLDLGNVVVRVDFSPFLLWVAEKAGHRETERVAPLLRSSLFYDFEFGHISPAEFTRRLSALYQIDIALPELEERFCGIFPGLVDGIEPAMEELAGMGPIYCLSNTNEIHLSFLRRHYPVMKLFTHVFASHEMHQRKPYPAIYVTVAEAIGVERQNLVFFDDVRANVEGALKAGLEAHLFESSEQVLARLKEHADLVD